jgi:hypothetical protein
MSKFGMFARLAAMMGNQGPNSLSGARMAPPTRKQLKQLRPPRFKPAFSMGHRGFPKTMNRPGSVPAPTIDQVRHAERKYGQRIHVKRGVMFFKSDGLMWTKDEAVKRQEAACGS